MNKPSPCTGTDNLFIPHRNSNFIPPHSPLSVLRPFLQHCCAKQSVQRAAVAECSNALCTNPGSQQLGIWKMETGYAGFREISAAAVLPRPATCAIYCDMIAIYIHGVAETERARELGEGVKGQACAEPCFAWRITLVLTQNFLPKIN